MSDRTLKDALITVVQRALTRVSDRILRLEVSKDWPVATALLELDKTTPLKILVQRPFKAAEFIGPKTTENAGVATGWRNDKDRDFAVVILGTGTGNLDAGLKDVRPLPRKEVVEEWKKRVVKRIGAKGDLAKYEVQDLLSELFNRVANGELPASKLEEYTDTIGSTPKVEAVCSNLWRLGLIPDSQAVDRAMARVRLSRNQELVDRLRESDDVKIDNKLEFAAESADKTISNIAKAAIAFRTSGQSDDLKDIRLPVLEEILKTTSISQGRAIAISELLDFHIDHPDSVRECLDEFTSEWDLDEPPPTVPLILEVPFVSEKEKKKEELLVRITLTPPVKEEPTDDDDESIILDSRWTGDDDDTSILAAESDKTAAEPLTAGQIEISSTKFRELAPPGFSVDSFLTSRSALRKYEPWLMRDAFSLLLLHDGARKAVRAYIDAWAKLAYDASQLEDQPTFVEMVQVLETVQGHDERNEPTWIVLGPLHPFRLDPYLRVAERIVECVSGGARVEKLGEAANWLLDRSYPAYPTIHRGRFTLHLISHRGLVIYSKNPGQYLPPVREANGLDRIFRAIEGYSPWLLDGMSILTIDAPEGGGVVRALENARQRRKSESLYVYHLTTGHETDTLDGFNGDLEYLPRVDNLADFKTLPPVNIILRFAAEPADAGQSAGAQWEATKGAHLALEISDVVMGGPFGAKRTPQIKIDPRYGNVVVRSMQALFRRLIGGLPMLATIRPLLQTDDAPVLSRMASGADWIVFAAPGPLGLVSPGTINHTLRFVGRSAMGNYGLYVYAADSMFPVRRFFEDYFRRTPVSTIPAEQLVSKLVDKALQSGHAVLFSSLNQVPAQVAALVAMEVAQREASEDDEIFVLSLDDMGWTRAWLSEGRRADYLAAYFRPDGTVLFRVVESKSESSGEQVPCDPDQRIYKEGLEQVRASLDSVREITTTASPNFDQDLRFASLIEHLMAAILMRVDQLDDSKRQFVFEIVNGLSRRDIVPKFEGMVVLSQSGVNQELEARRVNGELKIVWAGAPETNRVFGIDSSEPVITPPPIESTPTDEGLATGAGEEMPTASKDDLIDVSKAEIKNAEMASAFIAAARIHGIPVVDDQPVYIQEGPSLFAVGFRIKEGTTIQPLRARLADIARDIGLGDRANEMDVENDSEPRTVRVLLPRPDRHFPELPGLPKIAIGSGGYLPIYIGKTVDGTDWSAAVESWPHLLAAGTTGSGKTTFVRSILRQLKAYGCDKLQTVVVDGKGDTDYLGVLPPDLFAPKFPDVQLGHQSAIDVLKWATEEMEGRRKQIMEIARQSPSPQGVKAADLYRAALTDQRTPPIVPLIIIIDEFADIMLASKKSAEQFEDMVQRICQVGRSRLIHLILATQRPDKETIRGAIKANLNARAVFRLPAQADSMTVLGRAGAERLMLHGDMLFQHGTGSPIRLQGYKA
jgi:FtsK/SpoIIIE family